ncbi:MAG: signal recognition particle-docking protein FtsY [Clostridiales bacterium]|nr:signal recognition particle-docking protein FtsY [Clostridiales bacterium]MDY5976308.1 signal recognition particle-docking protein FtsY [Anaerovoracaceae bacterium]
MAFTENRKSFFGKLSERISEAITGKSEIDDDFYDELEEILITSDIGMDTTIRTVEKLRAFADGGNIKKADTLMHKLKDIIVSLMDKGDRQKLCPDTPLVILVIGVNGGGKTTSIGKIANMLTKDGKKVILAAADTFRAAAADQLTIWADRVGIDIVKHNEGADPSAVIFDAVGAAKARGADVLICDTAGRLQNKKNLMNELEKMNKVISREWPEAARENLLVLDATTGKNAISQAREFGQTADITGIIITKLDGTAKGGIAVTIADEFDLPIKFIGVGEGIDDLKPFDPEEFAGGIVNE